jgi:hypothetical protein
MDSLVPLLAGLALPFALVWLKLAAVFARMAKRKNTNTNWALIGAFPLWALPFGLWLMMQPNARSAGEEEVSDQSAEP